MTITALPAAPQPTDTQAQFNTKAFAFVAALAQFVTETNATAVSVDGSATTATTQAGIATTKAGEALASAAAALLSANNAYASEVAAAASAASAAAVAGSFVGTSTSSLAIGTGNKTFVTQSGEQYTAGIWMTAVSAANGANYMFGQVVSYSGTSLVINVQATGGSGTFADWNLSLAGPRGAPGAGITPQATGFTAAGGTSTTKTLTVDVDLSASQVATLSGTQALTNKTITGTKETVYTITDGTGFEIDPANGGIQVLTLGASRTPAATNFASGQSVTLMIDDGSSYTINWSTVNVTWVGGTAPTLDTTKKTVVELWKNGSTIYGALVGAA